MLDELVYTCLWTGLFACLDFAIQRVGLQKPYYAVHAIHNALMVYATTPDLVNTFTDLHNLHRYPVNLFAAQICLALHLYHCALYWKNFHFDDWLHHGLMIGIALPVSCIANAHTFLGMSLFFTTGLPGGIDYCLLFGVRNGWIDKRVEKRVNTVLHVWIRSPGCLAMAGIAAASLLSAPSLTIYDWLGFVPGLLAYWNGQYFMQQVVTDAANIPKDL